MTKLDALKKFAEKLGVTFDGSEDTLAKALDKLGEEYEPQSGLPEVTADDNGKVLTVANGVWGKDNVNLSKIVAFCPLVGNPEKIFDLTDETSYFAVPNPESFNFPPLITFGERLEDGSLNIHNVGILGANRTYQIIDDYCLFNNKFFRTYELDDDDENAYGFKLAEHEIGNAP